MFIMQTDLPSCVALEENIRRVRAVPGGSPPAADAEGAAGPGRCQGENRRGANAVHFGRQPDEIPPRPPLVKGGWGGFDQKCLII